MKYAIALLLITSQSFADSPQPWDVQMRFKNGMVTNTTIMGNNYEIIKQQAQAQCGGPSNCTVIVYGPHRGN